MEKSETIDNQIDYYNHYWRERVLKLNPAQICRLAEILKAISNIKDINTKNFDICDLGCGIGWLSNELVKFGDVMGVDLSPVGVQLASDRWKSVKAFEAQNILEWRPDTQFDIVVSSEVIEHILDKQSFMATVNSIVKTGGYLILTTPNGKAKKAWDGGDQGAQMIEDWVTPKELKRLISDNFDIIYLHTFYNDFAYNRIYRILSAPKLLKILNVLGLMELYDGVRNYFKLGLYQIVIAKKR